MQSFTWNKKNLLISDSVEKFREKKNFICAKVLNNYSNFFKSFLLVHQLSLNATASALAATAGAGEGGRSKKILSSESWERVFIEFHKKNFYQV